MCELLAGGAGVFCGHSPPIVYCCRGIATQEGGRNSQPGLEEQIHLNAVWLQE